MTFGKHDADNTHNDPPRSSNCPKCGAGLSVSAWGGVRLYDCGFRTDNRGYASGGDAGCLRRQLAAMTKERDELRAIADKYPRTTDGVLVGGLDNELWYIGEGGRVYCHTPWRYEDIPTMYSTRAAAERAVKETQAQAEGGERE